MVNCEQSCVNLPTLNKYSIYLKQDFYSTVNRFLIDTWFSGTILTLSFYHCRFAKINQYQKRGCLWASHFMADERSPKVWCLSSEKGTPNISW